MGSRINSTLFQMLFANPKPLSRKSHVFRVLYSRMFPSEHLFRKFLTTSDSSEQVELAKEIIQRLCFEANFPPPFSLLIQLLSFETDSINKSSTAAYIPQDHFSHIIYTYLLGLYVFFYSPAFNKELTREFIRKRKDSSFDLVLDAAKDFVSYWKYFCLFHDLAYPIERFDVVVGNNSFSSYFTKFNNIQVCLAREILAECAAKYLVAWQLINDSKNTVTLRDVLLSMKDRVFIEREQRTTVPASEMSKDFSVYTAIDKLHCFEHFKMLTGFIGDDEYVIALFDALTEQPIALKFSNSAGVKYYILGNRQFSVSEDQIIRYLNHDEYLYENNYFIRFFVRDLSKKSECFNLRTSLRVPFSDSEYRLAILAINELSARSPICDGNFIRFNQINTSSDFGDYLFFCYRSMLNYITQCVDIEKTAYPFPRIITGLQDRNIGQRIEEFLKRDFEMEFKDAVLKEFPFSNYEKAKNIFESLKMYGTNAGHQVESTDTDYLHAEIDGVVRSAVNELFNVNEIERYKQKVVKRFADSLKDAIDNEREQNGALVEFIHQCNKVIFGREFVSASPAFIAEDGIDVELLSKYLHSNERSVHILSDLDSTLIGLGSNNTTFDFFIKKYKTSFLKYDHGIYGAIVFLICWEYYSDMVQALFEHEDRDANNASLKRLMSTLCWNIEYKKHLTKLYSDYHHIVKSVFQSVFLHNLYPGVIEELTKNDGNKDGDKFSWMYSLHKSPCYYFSMLIDALQVWNRSKYYRHDSVDWESPFASDEFDVSVKNDRIVLRVVDTRGKYEQLLKKFLFEKDSYLKHFSSYIEVDIIHE